MLSRVLVTAVSLLAPIAFAQQMPAQRHQANPKAVSVQPDGTQFGDPLPRLSAAQLEMFAAGKDEFLNVEDAEGGLGPIFNNSSCVSCHSVPAVGGSSAVMVTRFGLQSGSRFDPLTAIGGSLLQSAAIDPAAQEIVPAVANVIAKRNSTPLFGLGLIEAIPDAAILQNAARPQPDGIRGIPAEVDDVAGGGKRIGRFGWKAQLATLLDFAGDAYLNEMGVTSRVFPHENAPNGNAALLERFDLVADPEDTIDPATGKSDIDLAADYMRLLAPPTRLPASANARLGEFLFAVNGCASCHTPGMTTGPNAIAALDRKQVMLYSDLLLHDMGSLGDGIAQGFARPREMKTAPLWGVRSSAPYLHDGRAATVDAAIRGHEGEGSRSRDRYVRLPTAQRSQILEFLNTL
jgi:CxxC motif-containing protein (DUF1111 family)